MKENTNVIEIEAAKKIWELAGTSPEMGNAIMDLVGDEVYDKIMKIIKLQKKD